MKLPIFNGGFAVIKYAFLFYKSGNRAFGIVVLCGGGLRFIENSSL
jgi:hypothetical protein